MKKAKMKVKRLALFFISVIVLIACENPVIDENNDKGGSGSSSISLKIYVPGGSISTYSSEDASEGENYIETLYIDLYQNSTIVASDTLNRAALIPMITSNTNDSILTVAYEVEGLSSGTVTAKVYANRKEVNPITEEIPLPEKTAATSFLMTGEADLVQGANNTYGATIHIVRNVAKLRISVSKDAICLPSDLVIDYANIAIEVLHAADRTSLFGPVREQAAGEGLTYFNYAPRSGSALRTPLTFNSTDGGQIDSLYLNENFRSSYTAGTNTTQVRITIPTKSASLGDKTDTYTYTLYTNGSHDILRNHIYTLDIKVRGQSLEPLMALVVQPWNDISIDGSIQGTYLTMQTSEIEFDESGYAEIGFCTDAQAVYVDYSEFNDNNTIQIGREIKTSGIRPTDPNLTPGYQGEVLLDRQACTSFGFQLDVAVINPASYNFSGKICIKAGNIVKCISFAGQRIYDAHYIVGEPLLETDDKFTYADVTVETGSGWLEVSPDRLYTSEAKTHYENSTAVPLYLHLEENLSGSVRKGSVTVQINGIEKKIYIQQLPALPVGRFGYESSNNDDDAITFNRHLYTEQLHEYNSPSTSLVYRDPNDNTSLPLSNNIYNGLGMCRANFESTGYASLDWQQSVYRAMNYCTYKNRDENKNNTIERDEIKWYLPSQAQLMAMWVSYESYKSAPASNFQTGSYWSSTNNGVYINEAQYLNFNYGNVGHFSRTTPSWIRCVRNGGSSSSSSMVSSGDGNNANIDFTRGMPSESYSTDSKIGISHDESSETNATLYYNLEVSGSDNGTGKTWDEAKEICSNLTNGSWRLPTQKELQAIWILQTEILKVNGFMKFADDYYWTSTDNFFFSGNAYMVYMSSVSAGSAGNTPNFGKTNGVSVRCVKEL